MIFQPKNAANVFVVDSKTSDYSDLRQSLSDDGGSLEVFGSARAALRNDPESAPELWVVNMSLPDMSGPDLLSMLRWRYPGVPVFLVSDDYRVEDEIHARSSGAEMYLCKPLEGSWLSEIAQAN